FKAMLAGASNAGGSIKFKDGATVLGSAQLAAGVATLTTAFSSSGTRSVVAEYPGDFVNAASVSSALMQIVEMVPTAVTLVSSSNPATPGTPVPLTATITGSNISPSGTVTFRDGGNALGTVSVAPQSSTTAMAVLSVVAFTTGVHSLTASYSGDST